MNKGNNTMSGNSFFMSSSLMTQVKECKTPIRVIFRGGIEKTGCQQKYLTTLRLYKIIDSLFFQ
jgi:hypothetical protein